jgi:hypothetical protein
MGDGNSAAAGKKVRFMPCGSRIFCSMKDASDRPETILDHDA